MALADVQAESDARGIAINEVGIRDIQYPVQIKMNGHTFSSVGQWQLTVALDASQKGTHMSRFVAWLNEHSQNLSLKSFLTQCHEVLALTHAQAGKVQVDFTLFLEKTTPERQVSSFMDYKVSLTAYLQKDLQHSRLEIGLEVPVKSLCPASKAMADHNAHSQRSLIKVEAFADSKINLTQLIADLEKTGSAELYALLKREDEKFITEHAYEHPKFVEDMVRDAARLLKNHPQLAGFKVSCENFESIHNHSAYALIVET